MNDTSELISPVMFEAYIALGNSKLSSYVGNFFAFRGFLARVYGLGTDEHRCLGLESVEFEVGKSAPGFLDLAIRTVGNLEIDTILSGETGDLMRITPELGVLIGSTRDRICATFLFCEYEPMRALLASGPSWWDWVDKNRRYYSILEAEWQRMTDAKKPMEPGYRSLVCPLIPDE